MYLWKRMSKTNSIFTWHKQAFPVPLFTSYCIHKLSGLLRQISQQCVYVLTRAIFFRTLKLRTTHGSLVLQAQWLCSFLSVCTLSLPDPVLQGTGTDMQYRWTSINYIRIWKVVTSLTHCLVGYFTKMICSNEYLYCKLLKFFNKKNNL